MSSPKEEYLTVLLQKQEVTSMLTTGAALVLQGGNEGIQEIAKTHPEIILGAIEGLALVVETQWKEHLALVEQYFELSDRIDALR